VCDKKNAKTELLYFIVSVAEPPTDRVKVFVENGREMAMW